MKTSKPAESRFRLIRYTAARSQVTDMGNASVVLDPSKSSTSRSCIWASMTASLCHFSPLFLTIAYPSRHRFRHRVEMTLNGELRPVAFNKQQDGEYDVLFYLVLRYTALVEGITPQHASSRPRSFPCLINILQTPHFHFLQTLLYSKSLIFRVPQNASLVLSPAYCPSSCTHRTGVRRYSRRGHLLEAQL